jgi:hypothetical protein
MMKSLFAVAATLVALPALAQAPALPYCSATVTDSCQQTKAQQARAMSAAQADARDARNGGAWTPNGAAAKPAAKKKK